MSLERQREKSGQLRARALEARPRPRDRLHTHDQLSCFALSICVCADPEFMVAAAAELLRNPALTCAARLELGIGGGGDEMRNISAAETADACSTAPALLKSGTAM